MDPGLFLVRVYLYLGDESTQEAFLRWKVSHTQSLGKCPDVFLDNGEVLACCWELLQLGYGTLATCAGELFRFCELDHSRIHLRYHRI